MTNLSSADMGAALKAAPTHGQSQVLNFYFFMRTQLFRIDTKSV